jgi:hypothetical protein
MMIAATQEEKSNIILTKVCYVLNMVANVKFSLDFHNRVTEWAIKHLQQCDLHP